MLIGSRYVAGGAARMPARRARLSRALNALFGRGLSLGVRDLSSGVRLYRTAILHALGPLPAHLDVGCGSSRSIGTRPPGSVAVDVLLRKLRYARRFARPLVHASGLSLPFADASFPCVLCSQVIEHVPKASPILSELVRVLQPGGRLVLGTPDYANWEWVVMEKLYGGFAPGGYADEHIAHDTRAELIRAFAAQGFTHEATRYILRGELILAFRKGLRTAG